MSFFRYDGWVRNTLGSALAGAQIYAVQQPANTAVLPPTPLASVYSDVNGLVPITQPISTDGFGHFSFYIASGTFTLVIVNQGIVQAVYPDQAPMGTSGGGGSTLTLKTGGVTNVTQTLLNLVAGSGMTIISDASGNVTFISTAGGGGGSAVTLQTNSVPNTIQSLLNLIPGTSMSLTADAFGGVTFALGNIQADLLFANDNTNDIGAIAANRPRTAYIGTSLVSPLVNATTGFQVSGAAALGNVLRGNGTNFVSAQLGYGDLSGTPQLAVTKAAIASNFLTSYTSTTGVFTSAQPTFTDLAAHPTTLAGYGITDGVQSPRTASFNFVIDGGGSVPATGAYGQMNVPVACTITGWVLTGDAAGDAVIDVLTSTYAGFPTTSSICSGGAGDKPTLVATNQKNENLSVSGAVWTTALAAGAQLQINLNSVHTCKRLNLTLLVTIP